MLAAFRFYANTSRFCEDYRRVRDFLLRVNNRPLVNPNFTWERWVWMISRPTELEAMRNQIGLWEAAGEIVGLVTFEDEFNKYFAVVDPGYPQVYDELVLYVKSRLPEAKAVFINIYDCDRPFQEAARKHGFCPTREREHNAWLSLAEPLVFALDESYTLSSMAESWDIRQYNQVMWKGFNHEGEADQSEAELEFRRTMLSSPDLKQDLTVVVADQQGNYLAHAGIWYEQGDEYAYIEPVATIPEARGKGLARACIYHALNRARAKGANYAMVGSDLSFYYRIGFNPHSSFTWWRLGE